MENNNVHRHQYFYAVGISYRKADAEVRGRFSLDAAARTVVLKQAIAEGLESLVVVSTCNRTEIYGFAQHPFQLIKLITDNSRGSVDEFQRAAFVYKNNEAAEHVFQVGTGLDSQILGDFEIIGQLKAGFAESKAAGLANAFMERLVNSVIQASKRVKNETGLSSGATSVSFASVQYIMGNVAGIEDKNILLFGTGKIGRNTCENLVKHTKNDHIVLINRTREKAEQVAGKFNLVVKDYDLLPLEIPKADVLIVATGAQQPTIDKDILATDKPLLILDLSIPKNVHDNVSELPNVKVIHLDDLSKITDGTLENRRKYIPAAGAIIDEVMNEFSEWTNARKFAPTINALKEKLTAIKDGELDFHRKKLSNFDEEQAEIISQRIIQKITTHFANHLRDRNTVVDESIEWIEKVFKIETSVK